jgi:hypothetical protein
MGVGGEHGRSMGFMAGQYGGEKEEGSRQWPPDYEAQPEREQSQGPEVAQEARVA